MLVLVAVCLVVFLGAAALAIDLGSFYGAQKKAQAAADAAALAASHDVAENSQMNTNQATTDVLNYVSRNDPDGVPSISYPTGTHSIKVTVSQSAPTFFGRIFGLTSERVSASATASANNPAPNAAVFAADTSCGGTGITFTGNNSITIDGSIHSNGSLTFTGASTQTINGSASYGGPNGCNASLGTATLKDGSWRDPANVSWPKDYTPVAGVCSSGASYVHTSTSAMTFSANGTSTLSGIYCAPSISFSGSGTYGGNATFIATATDSTGTFTISGNVTFNVSPDAADLASYLPAGSNLTDLSAMQLGTGTMQIDGNRLNAGSFFAPTALVAVDGNTGGTLSTCPAGQPCSSGYIEGLDVKLNGTSTLAITGMGPGISGDEGATLSG